MTTPAIGSQGEPTSTELSDKDMDKEIHDEDGGAKPPEQIVLHPNDSDNSSETAATNGNDSGGGENAVELSSIDASNLCTESEQCTKDHEMQESDIACSSTDVVPLVPNEPEPTESNSDHSTGCVGQGSSIPQPTDSNESSNNDIGSVYYLKWFNWNGETYPIVTQNENGPCPLLAIMNALTLSKRMILPYMQEIVTAQQLMEYLGDCMLSNGPQHNVDDELVLNFEQNMQDAIAIMHKLQTGIDVNVKFTGVRDFEYTSECVVFDLLGVGLYHGWLMNPQEQEVVQSISSHSYNQIVEKIILSKEEGVSEKLVEEGLVAEQFLERTKSQLTYHGLCELNERIKDGELCIFFRNNHFSTLYKYKGELFLLVTDQGYLTESQVIWETLANVEGDGQFVDSSFRTVAPKTDPQQTLQQSSEENLSQQQQDYLVALSLRDQEQGPPVFPAPGETLTPEQLQQREQQDLALAIQLQNEENNRLAQEPPRQQQQMPRPTQREAATSAHSGRHHQQQQQQQPKGNCIIL